MKISNYTQGRENNYNLIRIIAALAVLITHSYALSIGTGEAEPFRKSLGMTMGSIAVDIFFITSGFLVTASILSRQSAIEFMWARILRILPALTVMLILTVFVLGIFFTSLNPLAYLADVSIYIYLAKGISLLFNVSYNLPGVFEGNPYKYVVNGSLWSLPYEIKMYLMLVVVWISLKIVKGMRLKLFELSMVLAALSSGIFVLVHHSGEGHFSRLFFMFFSGASFYVLQKSITLSHIAFWVSLITLLIAANLNEKTFFIVYTLTITYILFYIAYIPAGFIRQYNQLGDYSYGVYIYAFPVQQSIAALIPGVSVLVMILISAIITLILSIFSWHLIEKPALKHKNLYIGHTRKIVNFGQALYRNKQY
jgi:peptidoglycan/LPS O-acetylase OafA/YrhL